jgi:hypothetical protein
VFLAGLYVILNQNSKTKDKEGMENHDKESKTDTEPKCPDVLIKKGNALLLLNSKKPIDNTNPIPFGNLDEYIYYLESQRKLGNACPILYLQEENNAQGKDVYRIRPSPFDLQGGLPSVTDVNKLNPFPPLSISNTSKTYTQPASEITNINNTELSRQVPVNNNAINIIDADRLNPPYNAGNYSGFDPHGQYVGVFTNLDEIHYSTTNNKFSDNPMDPNWGGVEYTQQMIDTGKYEENNINKPRLFQPKTAFIPIDPNRPIPKDVI